MLSESLGFWGLAVAPGKTYTQTVEVPFCLTMAALGLDAKDSERNAVVATVDGDDHVLCNLSLNRVDQQSLQHVFTEGTVVSFSTTGNAKVHLTGHYLPEAGDEDDEDSMFDYSDDGEGASDDEEMEDYDMDSDDEEDDEEDSDDNEVKVHHVKHMANGHCNGLHAEDDEDESDDEDYEEAESDEDEEMESDNEEDDDEEEEEEEEEAKPVKIEITKRPATSTTTSPQASKKVKVEEIKITTPKSASTTPNKAAPSPSQQQQTASPGLKKKTLPSGLVIEDIKLGSGKRAKQNSKCKVEYTGTLPNGKVFDASKGRPFEFVLGTGKVIKGWDLGVDGMLVGGERKLIVPAKLAYGDKGAPPTIPKNATLHFTVKLVSAD